MGAARLAIATLTVTFCAALLGAAAEGRVALQHCSLNKVTLRVEGPVSEKTEQHTLLLTLKSHITSSCVLDGYPTIALLDGHGRFLPFRYTHRGDEMITGARPRPLAMRFGTSAYFALNKTACQVHTTRGARALQITLPGSRQTATIPLGRYAILDYCGEGFFGRVAVSPFERQPYGWACHAQGSCERQQR